VCVKRYIRNHAAKEMQGETCSQCSYGGGNETTSCKDGCHGNNTKESTKTGDVSDDESENLEEEEEVVGEQAAEE
jgi:hypothetical protein